MGWVITLALRLRLALVRRTLGARSLLLMGICLGSLIEVVHVYEGRKRKEGKKEGRKGKEERKMMRKRKER